MRPHPDTCASTYANVGADTVPQPPVQQTGQRTIELQSLYPQATTWVRHLLTAVAVSLTAYTGLALLSFCVATLGGPAVLAATLGLGYGAVVTLGMTRVLQDLRRAPRTATPPAPPADYVQPPRTHPKTFAALVDNDATVVDHVMALSSDLPLTKEEKTVQMRMVYDL
jgi:hypothetical protein